MNLLHTHIGINTSRFHVSQHTIPVIHYLLRDDRKQRIINKKNRKLHSSPPESLAWLCTAPSRVQVQAVFLLCLFQKNKWTSWTACDICMTGARASEQFEQPKPEEFARSKKQFVTKPSEDPHLAAVATSIIIKPVMTSKPCHFHSRFFLLISSLEIIPLLLGADLSLHVLQRKSPNAREWEVWAEITSWVASVKAKRERKVMLHWLELHMDTTTRWQQYVKIRQDPFDVN